MAKIPIRQLLSWANHILQSEFESLDEFNTGAAYIQILHSIFPKEVPISKVRFIANYQYEVDSNFMLLKNVFKTLNLSYPLEIRELIRGQRHYRLLSWLRDLYQKHDTGAPYDALAARKNQPIGFCRGYNNALRKTTRLGSSTQSLTSNTSTGSRYESGVRGNIQSTPNRNLPKRIPKPKQKAVESSDPSACGDDKPKSDMQRELSALRASKEDLNRKINKVKYFATRKDWLDTPDVAIDAIRSYLCIDDQVKSTGNGNGDGDSPTAFVQEQSDHSDQSDSISKTTP
ncbi:protein BIM1-like [Scaptodrosophila lebanonensis]|uniref:Protein BIM1-like n=1 Tax=Drosophila lebanonensis TaxID=7225 RepID=A0A6J2U4R8_DROLE|nr:protein BIM1-like [Scaptodrosophila lebanonensis]